MTIMNVVRHYFKFAGIPVQKAPTRVLRENLSLLLVGLQWRSIILVGHGGERERESRERDHSVESGGQIQMNEATGGGGMERERVDLTKEIKLNLMSFAFIQVTSVDVQTRGGKKNTKKAHRKLGQL